MYLIENKSFDEERAFYASRDLKLVNCKIDGKADGESAFKESELVELDNCFFNLRYPLWHCNGVSVLNSRMTPLCRAALWYSRQINVKNTDMHGIKALRECSDVLIENSDIASTEFGWFSKRVTVNSTSAAGEYFMFKGEDLYFSELTFNGKYSFQYVNNATFENCDIDTKDAFWHAKNIVVRNCRIKGEYLAWYSENVTFENCIISGTQPLCYCKGLRLINCRMDDADLAFELSDVNATLTGRILSIKNPKAGEITAPSVGEIISDIPDLNCKIVITEK